MPDCVDGNVCIDESAKLIPYGDAVLCEKRSKRRRSSSWCSTVDKLAAKDTGGGGRIIPGCVGNNCIDEAASLTPYEEVTLCGKLLKRRPLSSWYSRLNELVDENTGSGGETIPDRVGGNIRFDESASLVTDAFTTSHEELIERRRFCTRGFRLLELDLFSLSCLSDEFQ